MTSAQHLISLLEAYIHPEIASSLLQEIKQEILHRVRQAFPHLVLYALEDLEDINIQQLKYALFLDHESSITDFEDLVDFMYRRRLQRYQDKRME